eukprot:6201928-Heterocapsa_arctica.AAC.2
MATRSCTHPRSSTIKRHGGTLRRASVELNCRAAARFGSHTRPSASPRGTVPWTKRSPGRARLQVARLLVPGRTKRLIAKLANNRSRTASSPCSSRTASPGPARRRAPSASGACLLGARASISMFSLDGFADVFLSEAAP